MMCSLRRDVIGEAKSAAGKLAQFTDVPYGRHPNKRFDLWQAQSDSPAPLVMFYHGGGFEDGERDIIYGSHVIDQFLDAGVSFATVDYRYHNQTARGIRGSLGDCVRALQFLRHHAEKFHIDKTRIGAFGSSAGGGASLWIAFHDDMALTSGNIDPVFRESTRLSVVGARATQSTYDIPKWLDVVKMNEPPIAIDEESLAWKALLKDAVEASGFDDLEDLYTPEGIALRQELDMLSLMSCDDPPMWVFNSGPIGTQTPGLIQHHPCHAFALCRQAKEVGLEARVSAPHLGLTSPCEDMVMFFLWHLLEKPDLCEEWHDQTPWEMAAVGEGPE